MNALIRRQKSVPAALVVAGALVAAPGAAQETSSVEAVYEDIEATVGQVPTMFEVIPEETLASAWSGIKNFQLNPETALSNKVKELIGLAVAAQVPCDYCIYFHTKAAMANGATEEEIREAVAMAALTRRWSTVLNGMQVDLATWKAEIDEMLRFAAEQAASAE